MPDTATTSPQGLGQRFSMPKTVIAIVWFPLFFFVGFLCFYFIPLHHVAPHHLPLAVVGRQVATQFSHAFGAKAPGAFDFHAVSSAAAVRHAIFDRSADGGIGISSHTLTLYSAAADSSSISTLLQSAFGPLASAEHLRLSSVDVAPLTGGDSGTSFLYGALALNIGSYILVMFTLQQFQFGRVRSLLLITVFGAAVSAIMWPILWTSGALPEKGAIVALSFLLTQAVAWTSFGLAPLARRAVPALLLALFVLFSIPSSGGVVPRALVPGFYQFFGPVMPLGNFIDAGKGILYLHGQALVRPIIVLLAWWLFGAALVAYTSLKIARAKRQRAEAESQAAAALGPVEASGADGTAGSVSPDESAETVRGSQEITAFGTVLDNGDRPVEAGTVTAVTADGSPLARVAIRPDGSYAMLLPIAPKTDVVLTAFGADHGAGAELVHVGAGDRRIRREIHLTAEHDRRISQDRYDTASALAAGALAGGAG